MSNTNQLTEPQFHCNNKGRHFSDPGYKDICAFQCAECAEFCPSQPTGKQLTPDVWEIFCAQIGLPYDSVRYNLTREDFIQVVEKYATQQTAALREELKSRNTEIRLLKNDVWYGVKEVSELHTQVISKDARIKELEEMASILVEGRDEHILKIQEKDARIAELEGEWDVAKQFHESAEREITIVRKNMIKFVAQRDEAVGLLKERILADIEIDFLNKKTGELYEKEIPYHLIPEWRAEILSFLSRLASVKTNEVSPWISVDDHPPTVGERYNFINDVTHSNYYGEVFGGKYLGERFGNHEFSLPGHCMTAKYYCPISAPREIPDSSNHGTKAIPPY